MDQMNIKEAINTLTDEQKKQLAACKSPEELTVRLGELGVELPDELLDAVAGGAYYQYNEEKKTWDIFLKDGYYLESQDIKGCAECIAGFYTYLEEKGEI